MRSIGEYTRNQEMRRNSPQQAREISQGCRGLSRRACAVLVTRWHDRCSA